jgi:hypothetical protein
MLIIAAGARFNRNSSKIISEPVLEPLPKGNARTFSEIDSPNSSWRLSEILPVAGSTHPQKLIGWWVDNNRPRLVPGNIQVAAISILDLSLIFLKWQFQRNPGFLKKAH